MIKFISQNIKGQFGIPIFKKNCIKQKSWLLGKIYSQNSLQPFNQYLCHCQPVFIVLLIIFSKFVLIFLEISERSAALCSNKDSYLDIVKKKNTFVFSGKLD